MWYKITFWVLTIIGTFLVVGLGTLENSSMLGIYGIISGNLLVLLALLIAFYGRNYSRAFDAQKKQKKNSSNSPDSTEKNN